MSTPEIDELVGPRAYQKWQARGCPYGDGLADWYAARAEVELEMRSRDPRRSELTPVEPERLAYERHIAAFV